MRCTKQIDWCDFLKKIQGCKQLMASYSLWLKSTFVNLPTVAFWSFHCSHLQVDKIRNWWTQNHIDYQTCRASYELPLPGTWCLLQTAPAVEKYLKSRSNRGLRNLRPIELKPIPYTLPAWPNVLGQPQQLVSLEQTINDVDISCLAHLHDPWRVPKRSHRLFRRDQLIHRSRINRLHPGSLLLLLLDHLHLITWTNVDHPSSCVLDHDLLASMIKIQPWTTLLRIILLSGN